MFSAEFRGGIEPFFIPKNPQQKTVMPLNEDKSAIVDVEVTFTDPPSQQKDSTPKLIAFEELFDDVDSTATIDKSKPVTLLSGDIDLNEDPEEPSYIETDSQNKVQLLSGDIDLSGEEETTLLSGDISLEPDSELRTASVPHIQGQEVPVQQIKSAATTSRRESLNSFEPVSTHASVPVEMDKSSKPVVDLMAMAQSGANALSEVQKRVDVMGSIAKTMMDHMKNCAGTDGHGRTIMVSERVLAEAQEAAITNVLNTKFGKKLENGVQLTAEEEKTVTEIIARTIDRKLGIDSSQIRRNITNLTDKMQVGSSMNSYAAAACGSGCGHGHGAVAAASHENHQKYFYCTSCEKTHAMHVHEGDPTPKCPKCKSSMKAVTSQKSH